MPQQKQRPRNTMWGTRGDWRFRCEPNWKEDGIQRIQKVRKKDSMKFRESKRVLAYKQLYILSSKAKGEEQK